MSKYNKDIPLADQTSEIKDDVVLYSKAQYYDGPMNGLCKIGDEFFYYSWLDKGKWIETGPDPDYPDEMDGEYELRRYGIFKVPDEELKWQLERYEFYHNDSINNMSINDKTEFFQKNYDEYWKNIVEHYGLDLPRCWKANEAVVNMSELIGWTDKIDKPN